jgi:hypothetical protein
MRFSARLIGFGMALMVLAACGARSDLNQVCQAFVNLEKQPNLQAMGHAERMKFVNDEVSSKLSRFSRVAPFWELVPNYEAEARYRMFKKGAEELAGPWCCPEMERLAPTLSPAAAP